MYYKYKVKYIEMGVLRGILIKRLINFYPLYNVSEFCFIFGKIKFDSPFVMGRSHHLTPLVAISI
jgi:hypothetical protein